jgi:hypothetical protein
MNTETTGVQLIANERAEQFGKHGFDNTHDDLHIHGELTDAAHYCITLNGWPWQDDTEFKDKIKNKTYKQRLITAGAFLAAEIDRLNRLEKSITN